MAQDPQSFGIVLFIPIIDLKWENIKHLQAKDKDKEMIWGWEGHGSWDGKTWFWAEFHFSLDILPCHLWILVSTVSVDFMSDRIKELNYFFLW